MQQIMLLLLSAKLLVYIISYIYILVGVILIISPEALLFARFYKVSYLQKFFQKLREFTNSTPLFSSNLIVIKNKVLWISRADEPDDVMWKNLGFSDIYKIKKRMIAAVVNAAILIVCLAAIFALSYLQVKI